MCFKWKHSNSMISPTQLDILTVDCTIMFTFLANPVLRLSCCCRSADQDCRSACSSIIIMPNAARAHLCNRQGELGKAKVHESDNPNPRFLNHGANTCGFKLPPQPFLDAQVRGPAQRYLQCVFYAASSRDWWPCLTACPATPAQSLPWQVRMPPAQVRGCGPIPEPQIMKCGTFGLQRWEPLSRLPHQPATSG